jgi:hypothetical protein
VRYADRLYANKARIDAELTWEMPLEIAGEVIRLINHDGHPVDVDHEYEHPRSMQ